MLGPFPVIGDCVSEKECIAYAYIEYETIRPGDLGIWHMPSQDEPYASKWLVQDSAGGYWLACKYFAVRFRPDFHVPIARVVEIFCGENGSLDPVLSASMTQEIVDLRSSPPRRADVVVFAHDLLQYEPIVTAINEHRRLWTS